jgi:hypothetical protein
MDFWKYHMHDSYDMDYNLGYVNYMILLQSY